MAQTSVNADRNEVLELGLYGGFTLCVSAFLMAALLERTFQGDGPAFGVLTVFLMTFREIHWRATLRVDGPVLVVERFPLLGPPLVDVLDSDRARTVQDGARFLGRLWLGDDTVGSLFWFVGGGERERVARWVDDVCRERAAAVV